MYKFNSIEEAIEDIKKGKLVVVIDDEDRENEGDLLWLLKWLLQKVLILWPLLEEGLFVCLLKKIEQEL